VLHSSSLGLLHVVLKVSHGILLGSSSATCNDPEKLFIKIFGIVAGAEAMFADLGHFSVRAIQVCFCLPQFILP
jgi:hypothetical protein